MKAIIFKESSSPKEDQINLYQMLLPRHLFIEEILFDICSSHVKNINSLRDAKLLFINFIALLNLFIQMIPKNGSGLLARS